MLTDMQKLVPLEFVFLTMTGAKSHLKLFFSNVKMYHRLSAEWKINNIPY